MPRLPLKFGPLFQNDDEAAISGANTTDMRDGFFLVNSVTQERSWHRRPGLVKHLDLGTAKPVDGLWWWDKANCMVAVSNGRMFKITDNNGTLTEITGSTLMGMRRPTFATDGTNLLVANGGNINLSTGSTAAVLTSANAPQLCSFVAWMDTYFLATFDESDKYGYSKVGNNPDSWSALDFNVAMSSPDNTVAMAVDGGEILLFGKQSVEVHYDDAVSPFARNNAATMNHGCIAPYSAMKAKGAWLWLNERRELVTPSGRTPQSLSEPIARVLQNMGEVADAKADSFTIAGQTFYLLSFPTDGRTLVFNLTTGEWCGDWGYFQNGEYHQWLGNCCARATRWNQQLVGSRIDGTIYRMEEQLNDDAGSPIRAALRTGNITYGTLARKVNKGLWLNFRRTRGAAADGKIMVRWRETNGNWGNEVWFPVTVNQSDTSLVIPLRGLGQYRSRQYEIVMTDGVPLVFMGAEEEFTII